MQRIFTAAWQDPQIPALMLAAGGADLALPVRATNRGSGRCCKPVSSASALAVFMVLYLCLCSSGGGAFIYFQF